jgi:hypothetical protein
MKYTITVLLVPIPDEEKDASDRIQVSTHPCDGSSLKEKKEELEAYMKNLLMGRDDWDYRIFVTTNSSGSPGFDLGDETAE